MPIPMLRLNEEQREDLASTFLAEIAFAVSERHELETRWSRYAEMYESRSVRVTRPWPDACGISIPMAPTHADSIKARLVNAYFGQDPQWIVKPRNAQWKPYAEQLQQFLQWVSDEELKLFPTLKQVFGLAVDYGTALTYTPWVTETKHSMKLTGDTFEEVNETTIDGPRTFVIPPWDWLIRGHEDEIQAAHWCGYKTRVAPGQIEEYRDNGFFWKTQADELLDRFGKNKKDRIGQRDPNESLVIERREQLAGLSRSQDPRSIVLYHLFATHNVTGGKFEQEIDFFFDPVQGVVPRAQFLDTPGLKRPFHKWGFIDRGPRVFWDIGVLELLEGLQDGVNTITRQVIDNNFVQNAKWFTILNSSRIKPGQAIRPGGGVYVNSHDEIQERDRGQSGQISSSITDSSFLMSQAQQRTGLSDPNLGNESGKDVPATTVLTLIQEGQKRLDLHIRDHRYVGGDYIMHVLDLYHQKKPLGTAYAVEGSKGEVIEDVWKHVGKEPVKRRVLVSASASTSVLNKSVDRQEKSQAFTLLSGFYDKINELLTLFFNAAKAPGMQQVIIQEYKGLREVMKKILMTHEFPDPEQYLPEITAEVLYGVGQSAVPVNGGVQQPGGVVASPLEMGGTPGVPSGPGAPLGRPLANVPRLPGTTPRKPPGLEGLS